jgi:hypothetical protein
MSWKQEHTHSIGLMKDINLMTSRSLLTFDSLDIQELFFRHLPMHYYIAFMTGCIILNRSLNLSTHSARVLRVGQEGRASHRQSWVPNQVSLPLHPFRRGQWSNLLCRLLRPPVRILPRGCQRGPIV